MYAKHTKATEWTHTEGDVYEITGTLFSGRRFHPIILKNPALIRHYNIYRGTVWVRPQGGPTRHRLWQVYN